ncbi:ATP-dependent RecD-like DNA helicase [Tumidithrix helvetica PCC 7403]|uniref:SF1B family DNA helicase RecD2 n=1 Tax=Tumidithrix helvetica TaxID=3457545 RepID=UPI003C81F490
MEDTSYSSQKHEQLQGVVERLTFHSADTGYTVARLKAPQEMELVTIVGSFPDIQAGQTLKLEGFWRSHPKYGDQFQVTQYQETKPATLTGLEKYLGSGLIKGVGVVTAKRIVAHFGLETLDIIENQIDRLNEVPGIAQKRIVAIQQAWQEQKSIKDVMVFLQGHGVSTVYAVKIFKQYGKDSIATVTDNPYRLATDIYGIGFITADAIARNLGVAPSSEFRYRSGMLHVLGEAAEEGHCYLPQQELVERSVKQLSLEAHEPDAEAIAALIPKMVEELEIIVKADLKSGKEVAEEQLICYKPTFFRTEEGLAKRINQLLEREVIVDGLRVQNWIDRFTQKYHVALSSKQRQAVEMAASQRFTILTGNPGCGKTFTVRTIVALWKAMGKSIALASPTGRAAQRLAEVTGQEAKTIHRLLEFDPSSMGFKRDQDRPIDADAIVIDEASMLDIFLANSLMKAIPPDAQVLFVGDADQLPSVGAGNVLQDLIQSERVPVVKLTEVFRQAQSSKIVSHAHTINQGKYPQIEPVSDRPQSDCLWLNASEPEHGVQAIRDLLTYLVPALGFEPARDVQILCPMTRGEIGTRNLNKVLQELLNPAQAEKQELIRGSTTFRVGDRVLQQVNDYNREVFNGDLGVISDIDREEQAVAVQFGDRIAIYDYADLNEIGLAFATTIHKSQGSEYPVVILPIFMQHYLMLSRNLIYTGITRAKKLAILVGSQKAIGLAIRQVKDKQRYTQLDMRLYPNQAIN